MSIAREREIWDSRVDSLDVAALQREARFVAEETLWRWALEKVDEASLRPHRILDLGCGRGFTTLLLAERAPTVGIDISERSLVAGRTLADRLGVSARFAGAGLEQLPFRDGTFEVVAGRFVLHHAESLAETTAELRRVLVPEGRAVFVETWGRNPLLMFGREVAELFAVGDGTPDESPLTEVELATLGRHFEVELCFPQFTAFELLNRLFRRSMPLVRRFALARRWMPRLWTGAIRLDRWIERRFPAARGWGWFVGIVLTPR